MVKRNPFRRPKSNKVVQNREDGDAGAAKIDRAISAMRYMESSTVVLCKGIVDLNTTTVVNAATVDFAFVSSTDDFSTMALQFNTFKVKAMKFEVFPTNPVNSTPIAMSTFHAVLPGAAPATWVTEAAIVDAPDAKYLMPGADKSCFYWNATGPRENEFQDCNSFSNFGGLRYSVRVGSATASVATIVVTAQVVFKGRH